MLWKWAVTKVPWKAILVHAPTIVDAARKFYGTTKTPAANTEREPRTTDGIGALHRAIEKLEEREAQQAALFEDLARQVQEMATALEVLRARVLLASYGSAIAVVVTIVTATLVLWRGR